MKTRNKNPKRKEAMKMMTQAEIKAHVSPFLTVAWTEHKEAIKRRVAKQQAIAHERALKRKEERRKAREQGLTKV